jgi:hypothetical protein
VTGGAQVARRGYGAKETNGQPGGRNERRRPWFAAYHLSAARLSLRLTRNPFRDRLPPSMKPVTRRVRLKGRLRCLRAHCRLDQAVLMIDVLWLEYRATNPQLSKR